MKVRARVKKPEHCPEWAKCCDVGWATIHRAQGREMIVDTDVTVERGCFCPECGAGPEKTVGVLIVSGSTGMGNIFPLEFLDLDEGPLEPGTVRYHA